MALCVEEMDTHTHTHVNNHRATIITTFSGYLSSGVYIIRAVCVRLAPGHGKGYVVALWQVASGDDDDTI